MLVLVSSPLHNPWRAAAWRGSGWLVRIRRGRQVDVMDSEPQCSLSVHSLSMLIKVDSEGPGAGERIDEGEGGKTFANTNLRDKQ